MELDFKKVFKKKEKPKTPKEAIDEEILVMLEGLKEVDGDSEKYGVICDNAKKVAEIRAICCEGEDSKRLDRRKIDPNTVITAGAYIFGMVMILFFEADGGVIATRALQFLPKPRI